MYKDKTLSESENILQSLLHRLEKCENKKQAQIYNIKIGSYYKFFHLRIKAVKEWPFDWKIIL